MKACFSLNTTVRSSFLDNRTLPVWIYLYWYEDLAFLLKSRASVTQ